MKLATHADTRRYESAHSLPPLTPLLILGLRIQSFKIKVTKKKNEIKLAHNRAQLYDNP